MPLTRMNRTAMKHTRPPTRHSMNIWASSMATMAILINRPNNKLKQGSITDTKERQRTAGSLIQIQTKFVSSSHNNMLTTTIRHHKEDRFLNTRTRMTKLSIIIKLNLCQMAPTTFLNNLFNRNKTFSKIPTSRWCNHNTNILKTNRINTFQTRMPKPVTSRHHSLNTIILHKFKFNPTITHKEEWSTKKVLENIEIVSGLHNPN